MIRPVFSTLATVATALILSACGGGGSETTEPTMPSSVPSPGEGIPALVVSQRGDALTLDPYDENETPTFSVLSNIFDSLIETDADLNLIPCLAESWEIVDDLTWIFHLRQGVTFHSGDPFTADDVVFSIDRALHWDESEVAADIVTIDTVETIDDHTVRIVTTQPDPILLNRLFNTLIMDRESTEAAIAEHGQQWLVEHPNGTGAYRFAEWIKDDHLTLEAYADCWRGAPEIEQLIFRPISNDASRLAALLAGEVHLIADVPVRDTSRIEASDSLRLVQRASLRLIYLGMDCGREESPGLPDSPPNPFMDRRVREAIFLAIDEDAIIANVMNNFAVAAPQLVAPPVNGFDPTIERPAPNPERARELLAEAGFPDGFSVRLDGPNNRYVNDSRIMQAVAGQLARIGVVVEVDARPKSVFFDDEQNLRCSFFLVGWANSDGDAASTFEYLIHTNQPERNLGTANYSSHYSNPDLDALIEEASRTVDPAARRDVLHRAMRMAMEDLPLIPLHYQVDLYGVSEALDWTPRQDRRLRGFDMRWRETP